MEQILKVDEDIWPVSLRKVVNELVDRAQRKLLVYFDDTLTEPRFWEDEFRIVLGIPAMWGNAGSGLLPGGFKCVPDSPTTIRVYFGQVNSITPDNMNLGDIPPCIVSAGTDEGVVCLAVTVGNSGDSHDGIAVSAEIVVFATDPVNAEPVFYQALGTWTKTGGGLTVTPGGYGNGLGDQAFDLCGGLGGNPHFGPA